MWFRRRRPPCASERVYAERDELDAAVRHYEGENSQLRAALIKLDRAVEAVLEADSKRLGPALLELAAVRGQLWASYGSMKANYRSMMAASGRSAR